LDALLLPIAALLSEPALAAAFELPEALESKLELVPEFSLEFAGALAFVAELPAVAVSAGTLLFVLAQPLRKNPRSNTDKVESLTEKVIFMFDIGCLLLAGVDRCHYVAIIWLFQAQNELFFTTLERFCLTIIRLAPLVLKRKLQQIVNLMR